MLSRIVPSAVPRRLIADECIGFPYRAKMLDVTLGRGKSGRIADDAIAKLSLASERQSQPTQHLVFWDRDIPLGHDFLGTCEDILVDHRVYRRRAANPQVMRI